MASFFDSFTDPLPGVKEAPVQSVRMVFDYRNDAVHPMLSRARPLSQLSLEQAEEGFDTPGRDAYGLCKVMESDGAGGLTDFTMGGHVTKEAWSLNPYAGCLHACAYCYVPDTIRAERKRWGSYVMVKRDLPTRLARSVAKAEKAGLKHTVYMCTATDPYQPAEAEHRVTRKCLEILVRRDWPVEVLTRSPLVLRDLDLFTQLSQVRVGLSVPTLDDRVRRVLEPAAPAIPARLRALRKLSDSGIATFANYTPACPPTTHDADQVARTFLDAGAQWVNSKGLDRPHTILAPLWERLRGGPWEDLTKFFASTERQRAWRGELDAAFKKVGLVLSRPFFNPPFEWVMPPLPEPTHQTRITDLPRIPVLVPDAAATDAGQPRPLALVR
jgi:DNA repair photolyase